MEEMLVNRNNRKLNQVWKAHQWPKNQSHKGWIQLPLGSNQFGRPLRPSLLNTQLRRRRQFFPSLPNHQLVNNSLLNSRIRSRVRVSQVNQQRKPVSPLLKNQLQKKQVRPSQINQQQRKQVRPLQKNQQQRKQVRPTRPNSRIQQKKVVNRIKFFTPQELLKLAPQQDRAIWDIIIKWLPNDYSIPDPQFIHIYESFKNQKQ
jgi:hypothetical protein